jgi:AmpD protein
LADLSCALRQRYPLTDVAGHEHVAPGRKTDPGPCFDWHRYRKTLIHKELECPVSGGSRIPLRFPFFS